MSTNRKNVIRKATLSNFTREIIFRTIIVDRESHNRLSASLPLIMDKVNKTIQDVSLYIQDRRIPFISGKLTTYDNPQIHTSRIVLLPTEQNLKKAFTPTDRRNNSHLVEFQLSTIYHQITFSNSSCDAKLVLDEEFLIPATTDLFLDLAMFNSYSFLRDMSIEEKKDFSRQKFEYFKQKNLHCYYTYDDSDTLMYYSLAFSARKTTKKIDIPLYVSLWEDFLQTYYPGRLHQELPLELQLKQHVDFGQLSCEKILDKLNQLPEGSYLLIRLNKSPRTKKQALELNAIFGGNTLTSKNWKIIPTNQYLQIQKYVQTLHISVFKINKTTV